MEGRAAARGAGGGGAGEAGGGEAWTGGGAAWTGGGAAWTGGGAAWTGGGAAGREAEGAVGGSASTDGAGPRQLQRRPAHAHRVARCERPRSRAGARR